MADIQPLFFASAPAEFERNKFDLFRQSTRFADERGFPITAPRSGDRDRDCQAITKAMTTEIEKIARQFPDQYMWGHRRWK